MAALAFPSVANST